MGNEKKLSRREFLKKAGLGAIFFGLFGRQAVAEAAFAPITAGDNLSPTLTRGPLPPSNKDGFWIDTTVGGVLKYWDGTKWDYCKSVWG